MEFLGLHVGSTVNSITIDYAMDIADTGGTDTLYTTATLDLSGKTISGIETLSATSGTTTIDYNDLSAGGGNISALTGSGSVSINGTTSMDIRSVSVEGLGNDALHVNGTANDDALVLDFSQLDEMQFTGGNGNDTVVINNIGGQVLNDTNVLSGIETLNLASLSSGTASINFDMLYSLALTSSVNTDGNVNTYEIELNVDDVVV